ncbi:pyrazinamidase/nicotinamidase PncA [Mycobacterium tuberculosis KT-0072]|nr:pyrazinamidase/nicotinamidase PncA [Mycobacterium tuberculosis KT-0072]
MWSVFGSLAVTGGAALARAISDYLAEAADYHHVVATKDFHIDPGDHFSGTPDYSSSWPPHCVSGTPGADFHPSLDTSAIEAVFYKGAYNHRAGCTPRAQGNSGRRR